MILMYIIIFALWTWLAWYIATQFYEVAQAKGYQAHKYFWMPFCLGFVGYLLVIALPDRSNSVQTISDELPDL